MLQITKLHWPQPIGNLSIGFDMYQRILHARCSLLAINKPTTVQAPTALPLPSKSICLAARLETFIRILPLQSAFPQNFQAIRSRRTPSVSELTQRQPNNLPSGDFKEPFRSIDGKLESFECVPHELIPHQSHILMTCFTSELCACSVLVNETKSPAYRDATE